MVIAREPVASTDLQALKAFLTKAGKSRPLPSGLDDDLLLSMAKDLRMVEEVLHGDADEPSCMGGPLALLLHLMDSGGPEDDTSSLALSSLAQAMPVLQFAIEREIVSRIVGAGSPEDDSNFMRALSEATGL